ncbi:hypothetical protein BOTBODRAFT_27616 [Botryobasidium botryosum FD-172 SS1]|uniref:F-box domain-containing protein n=1 Tax=Botryobasidium botryosum (strain FD-172 SS1) TaxID=930990 RepID=A0A067MWS9_BOTB1|nr:hypothetical protein BOTBODRAFT_27616 [Botryobasidium botryosum FD-172 SS1]
MEDIVEHPECEITLVPPGINTSIYAERSLPPEILGHIFSLIPAGESWTYNPLIPIHLSSVCRYWREVALGTGVLWSTITFSRGPPCGIAEIFLSRSKNCPLNMILCRNRAEWSMAQALEIALPTSSRWESLLLELTFPTEANDIMSLILNRFESEPMAAPPLRDLTFVGAKTLVIDPSSTALFQSFVDKLKPRSVSFLGLWPGALVPHEHLTHLWFQCLADKTAVHPEKLDSMLHACTGLETLVLSHVRRAGQGRLRGQVVLPALKNLTVYCGSATLAKDIFTSLHAPLLHTLKLRIQSHQIKSNLRTFLLRHGPSIRVLKINRICSHTINFFEILPSLEVFGLIGSCAGPSLQRVASYYAQGAVLPQISTIEINVGAFDLDAVQSLNDISTRLPLRTLSVRARTGYAEEQVQENDRKQFCGFVKVVAWDLGCEIDSVRTRCFGSSDSRDHASMFGSGSEWLD